MCENDNMATEILFEETVTWTMTAGVHTVSQCTDNTFSSCTSGFQSGILGGPGETYSTPFPQAGIFFYRCNVHFDRMFGQIIVTDPRIDTDGDTVVDELDPDDDNDGVLDPDDACPHLAGSVAAGGCPPVGGIAGVLDGDATSAVGPGRTALHASYAIFAFVLAAAALAGALWRTRFKTPS